MTALPIASRDRDQARRPPVLVARPRPWPGPLSGVWWTARALRNELWGFRFDFPVEFVAAPGPLEYYIYSERLFFDVMDLDAGGVPVHRGRVFGRTYTPSYVAWYGLMRLARALRGADPGGRDAFLTQVEWLVTHAVRRDDGAAVWHYDFDWIEGGHRLRAPWISAMAQGLAISALVRAHRLSGDARLIELAMAACRVFAQDVAAGGVRSEVEGCVLYEEYPGSPRPGVLDGFLFSLLGLHDLFVETQDAAVFRLLTEGIRGLVQALPRWNYRDRWSWYGAQAFLCPPHYNRLNGVLLASLAALCGEPALEHYARAWDPARLPWFDRAEVLLTFFLTKNRSRVRHHLARRLHRGAPAGPFMSERMPAARR